MLADLSSSSAATRLQSSIRGLHATPTAPLPFLKRVVVRSFVLEREQGDVIVHNAPGITAARRDIMALGRPDRLLVNHWHEAMYDAPDLDVPIVVLTRSSSDGAGDHGHPYEAGEDRSRS